MLSYLLFANICIVCFIKGVHCQCTTFNCGDKYDYNYSAELSEMRLKVNEIQNQNNILLEHVMNQSKICDKCFEKSCPILPQNTCPNCSSTAVPITSTCPPCSESPARDPPYNETWQDCADVFKSGHRVSGVFKIKPPNLEKPVDVFCDTSNGGGWTVFQRRRDGTVSFNHTWDEYKAGFGDLTGEFWLGNDILQAMTMANPPGYKLRIDLMNFKWETRYAEYSNFRVRPETEKYMLNIGAYAGTAGDSFAISRHNGRYFSTPDRDNSPDKQLLCPQRWGTGWWFVRCASALLNGWYRHERFNSVYLIWWYTWDGWHSLKESEMKFRPMDY